MNNFEKRKLINSCPNSFINIIDKEINSNSNIIKLKYETAFCFWKIRIFGEEFVKINKNNCVLFIDGNDEKMDLISELNITPEMRIRNKVEITLVEINPITNFNYMFAFCSSLIEFSSISNFSN